MRTALPLPAFPLSSLDLGSAPWYLASSPQAAVVSDPVGAGGCEEFPEAAEDVELGCQAWRSRIPPHCPAGVGRSC